MEAVSAAARSVGEIAGATVRRGVSGTGRTGVAVTGTRVGPKGLRNQELTMASAVAASISSKATPTR